MRRLGSEGLAAGRQEDETPGIADRGQGQDRLGSARGMGAAGRAPGGGPPTPVPTRPTCSWLPGSQKRLMTAPRPLTGQLRDLAVQEAGSIPTARFPSGGSCGEGRPPCAEQ